MNLEEIVRSREEIDTLWFQAMRQSIEDGEECIRYHFAALVAEQPKHPGYIIGSHWLETAYSRICAGEAEADVLRDIGLVRITDGMVETADIHAIVDRQEALRRDAERLKDAMRKAMAMLDKHEPEPAGAFAVLLLALNPELQSAKNALRRED